ncbi:NeuD/PglB/VioB family sugar acetyltransferase [uncultured Cellulomonas sp.]|uniref:NeuD/PglB/VioB family sugar acetyltransferase n=1 Tax=uncultured Cellulomonas sp. TaxID=189682 RepID=UPI0026040FB4|nr:NeuD/PglB/VioB family sugar acetyltransferase [uncultured Cellulomonas sp.]
MPRPTPLLLLAASGLAREVLAVTRLTAATEVLGVLDDDVDLRGTTLDGVPVLGGVEEVKRYPTASLLLCMGRGSGRERLAERLSTVGVDDDRYFTLVHPDVRVSPGCMVGTGSILLAGVVLTAGVRVGRHVVVMPNATLTHDDVVEDFVTLASGVSLGGGVRVGRAAYVGMNASVRERVMVGVRATLGMGAALLTDLPDGETWAGVPARPLDQRPTRPGEV